MYNENVPALSITFPSIYQGKMKEDTNIYVFLVTNLSNKQENGF